MLGLRILARADLRADDLYTRGGERLTGKIVSETAEVVVFRSTAFGTLRVARSDVARLERGPEAAGPPSRAPGDCLRVSW